jgi:CPA1 family monovalent cation:H+ antiporter
MITMIFAVVVFTLLIQGLSMKTLLKRLGLISITTLDTYEERKGEIYALERARLELEEMHNRGALSQRNYEILAPPLQDRLKDLKADLHEVAASEQSAVTEELHHAEERLLHAEKDGIREAYLSGIISERAMKKLLSSVDDRLFALEKSREKHPAPEGKEN